MKKISKQNRQEFGNEKRVKELAKRGFNHAAIAGMMEIPEHHAKRMIKHKASDITLDGKL